MTTLEVPDILSAQHLEDPWTTYEVLRNEHPVAWHEGTESWLVSRYEDVRPILKDNQRFSTEMYKHQVSPVYGDAPTFIEMDGREHSARRALVNPFLHSGGLERYSETIERRAHLLLDPLFERERNAVSAGRRSRAEADLVTEFSSLYPVDIMADMMNLPDADYGKLADWYGGFLAFIANLADEGEARERGIRAREEWGEYVLPLIAQRRRDDGNDLISLLCRAESDGLGMSDEEIRSFLSLMLVAGAETTDHQIAALMLELINHPEQLRALREDRGLIDAAMAEAMRFCSIVAWTQRMTREEVEVGAQTIPSGATITLLLGAANRDPRRFERADEFDIFRTDNNVARAFSGSAEHVGFGGGRHYCIGSMLSKREVEIGVGLILDRTTDLQLAPGFVPEPTGLFIRALPSLRVSFKSA